MADIKSFYIGQSEEYIKNFTQDEVECYAKITGDYNYIHMDEEKAGKSFFKGRKFILGERKWQTLKVFI